MEQKVWNLEAKKAKLKVLAAHFKEKEQLFAGKEIYHCCCGHCTNQIIKVEGGEEPYF